MEEHLVKPPVILCLLDSCDTLLLPHLKSLEWHLEAIDVLNEEYMAFDSEGYEITLSADLQSGRVQAKFSGLKKKDVLKNWIVQHYSGDPGKTLPDLIEELKITFRFDQASAIRPYWLNYNQHLRIGKSFKLGAGMVWRIAIGSKSSPLPAWIPGVVKGALHFALREERWRE
ncbi:MAG: hypothetical protein ACK555_20825 [Acidobacteriota bacterium]